MVMGRRTPWSILSIGVICCLFCYLVIENRLDGGRFRPAFNSRMLMMQNAQQHPVTDAAAAESLVSNTDVISAIDRVMRQMTNNLPPELNDDKIKQLSQELAQEIASYVVQRLGQQQQQKQPDSSSSPAKTCQSYDCWKDHNVTNLPVIYLITPTYQRPAQIPELTRMAQTLLNVPAIHWIVVEDANATSPAVAALLSRYGIPHTHLKAQMPEKYQKLKYKPKGVANRNAALDWVRANCKSGVIYMADDDNTYDIRLFEEMRYTKKVSMWPVGLVTKVGLSSPVVDDRGVVVDFYDGWFANRKFPVDMAGFAVNVEFLLQKPNAVMPFVPGHEEDGFLKKLDISKEDIEAKADGCTKILVWHTQTKPNPPANRTLANQSRYKGTNIARLQHLIV